MCLLCVSRGDTDRALLGEAAGRENSLAVPAHQVAVVVGVRVAEP